MLVGLSALGTPPELDCAYRGSPCAQHLLRDVGPSHGGLDYGVGPKHIPSCSWGPEPHQRRNFTNVSILILCL